MAWQHDPNSEDNQRAAAESDRLKEKWEWERRSRHRPSYDSTPVSKSDGCLFWGIVILFGSCSWGVCHERKTPAYGAIPLEMRE